MRARFRRVTRARPPAAHASAYGQPLSPHPAAAPAKAAKGSGGSIRLVFVKPDGGRVEVTAPVGDSLLEVRLPALVPRQMRRARRARAATRPHNAVPRADCARKQGGN